ncbi:F0F1 ATP synthase subunit beta [alpha proteobacterium BAL199]|nr:F0F1 ATP synthase subunit beta [alpha proteobacterium BAL199]
MTITLPSSRSDFVALALSAALAGGVLFAPYPSTAQTTIDPERASHELKRIEADLAGGRSTKAQLDRLAADLDREITRLRAEMAEATSRHQRTEETVTEVEATLSVLRHEAGEKRAVLAGREIELGRLVGALQRLARRPPETLLLMRRSPLETVRTGILLEAAIPQINAEAERLKAELASLAAVEADIRGQRARLDGATVAMDNERTRLAALALEKQQLLASTENRAASTAERLQSLGDSARSLRELMERLDAQRVRERAEQQRLADLVRPTQPAAPETMVELPKSALAPLPEARPAPPSVPPAADAARPAPSPGKAALLAMLPSAPPIRTAKGQLIRPATGSIVRRFGQRDPEGLHNRGLVIGTRSAATVVAPYDGTVIYAGAFEGFGLILIIEHGEGYHTLLAGLGRIDLQVGQRVLAGEPVGAMRSQQAGGGTGSPELYVELRHNGDPIDPLPWIAGLTGKAKG